MTNNVIGRGSTTPLNLGSASFTKINAVITSSQKQVAAGTRQVSAPFNKVLSFRLGTAKVYDLNPVAIRAVGKATAGQAGLAYFVSSAAGSFSDFAIYDYDSVTPYYGTDPVDGIITADNQGAVSGGVGDPWTQVYRVFYPPKAARFVVPRPMLSSVPASGVQYLDAFQTEVLAKGATAVSAYATPRSLKPRIAPTRLNFSEAPTRTPVAANTSDVQGISELTPGEIYIASVEIEGTDPSISIGEPINTGQINGTWTRVWVVFQARADSEVLTISATGNFRYRFVLVERGEALKDWFDGDSGADYLWEAGGMAGLTRSYFYEDRVNRNYLLMQVLQENVPMGVTVESPNYASISDIHITPGS